MADEPTEEQTKTKFQSWMNELLDKRQADSDAAAEEKRKAEAEEKAKRTREPFSALRDLIGF